MYAQRIHHIVHHVEWKLKLCDMISFKTFYDFIGVADSWFIYTILNSCRLKTRRNTTEINSKKLYYYLSTPKVVPNVWKRLVFKSQKWFPIVVRVHIDVNNVEGLKHNISKRVETYDCDTHAGLHYKRTIILIRRDFLYVHNVKT